jgi:hypothetical protein
MNKTDLEGTKNTNLIWREYGIPIFAFCSFLSLLPDGSVLCGRVTSRVPNAK